MARHVGRLEITNCVSPQYIKKRGKPKSPSDLSRHRLIHYTSTLGAKPFGFEYEEDGGFVNVNMEGSITVNNSEAYLAACLAGFGIAQMPRIGVRDLLAKGDLIEVLPTLRAEAMPVSILYPHRRNLARRVAFFIDWLETELVTHMGKESSGDKQR